ncbi:MAG: amino acid ABC transporter permease [Halobacteriovoraceae bacterium]|nr:amino acid ABC transporter permease [Halobacteriovoraceae bacterium]
MRKSKFIMSVFFIILTSSTTLAKSADKVKIGSKIFGESMLISEMVAQLLEINHGLQVERKLGLGGTKVVFDALTTGGIDIYPEYTGTGYIMILKEDGLRDSKRVFARVQEQFNQKFQLEWSQPLGFNNTYTVAVRRNDKKFKNIENLSQLSDKDLNFKFASAHEFMERQDGFNSLIKAYRLRFPPSNITSMQAGLMYSAIKNESVDMIMAYSTDGRIGAFNLKTLKDDLMFFPPYEVALLASKNSLKKFPALKAVMKTLAGEISETEMIEMNDQVDRLKRNIPLVAKNFLIGKGLIDGDVQTFEEESLISFFKNRLPYLKKLFIEHMLLSLGALFMACLISIPLGILLTRKEHLTKFIFPIVNTIQTIPSIALLGFMIPLLGIGYLPALIALFLYSLLPLLRNTYEGIKGVDHNYIEASRGMGLSSFQILRYVEIPLALPVMLAGLRTAAVIVIGTATLAAMVGAGGFGDPIFKGVATVNTRLIFLGAIPAALLAILVDKILGIFEKIIVSPGLRDN